MLDRSAKFPLFKFPSIRTNCTLLGVALFVLPHLCFASQIGSTPRLEEQLGKLFAAAEYVISQIDPTLHDLKALQQSISTSAEELTQWVQSNTAWVPYQGALKGAQGTLLARQGNLVDRTLLLGSLLQAAGYEVQIGRVEASDALRKIMRQAVKGQKTQPGPDIPEQISSDHVREIAQVTGLSEAEIWAGIEQQAKTAVRFEQEITVTLEEHFKAIRNALGTSLAPKSFEPWDDVLTEYYWVQYRDNAQQKWRHAHLVDNVSSVAEGPFSLDDLGATYTIGKTNRGFIAVYQKDRLTKEIIVDKSRVDLDPYVGKEVTIKGFLKNKKHEIQCIASPCDPITVTVLNITGVSARTRSASTFVLNALPDELVHRLVVRVVAVRDDGKSLHEEVAVEQSVICPYVGIAPIRISIAPSEFSAAELIKGVQHDRSFMPVIKRLNSVKKWTPLIRVGRKKFEIGRTISADGSIGNIDSTRNELETENLHPMEEDVDTIGNRSTGGLGTAADQLKILIEGKKSSASVLSSVRVEFELKQPGEATGRIIARPIYHRTETVDSKLSKGSLINRYTDLFVNLDVLLLTSQISPIVAINKQMNSLLDQRLAIQYLEAQFEKSDPVRVDTLKKVVGRFSMLPSFLYSFAAQRASQETYYSSANLIGFWERLHSITGSGPHFSKSLDLIANSQEPLVTNADEAFDSRLRAGIWDSILESKTTDQILGGKGALSVSSLFTEDERSGWRLWKEGKTITDVVSQIARSAMEKDLGNGYVLLARTKNHSGSNAWWRINPTTGECLGMLANRNSIGGAAMSTRVILTAAILPAALIAVEYGACLVSAGLAELPGGPPSASASDCLRCASWGTSLTYITEVAAVPIGMSAVGGPIGAGAGALFAGYVGVQAALSCIGSFTPSSDL